MADISKISPDNGTTIYNLKDIEARKRVPEVLLKDTVGWSGKNLLKNTATSQTINGVTFTVNSDGSVTANGTASAQALFEVTKIYNAVEKCIFSGCPQSGSTTTYDLRMGGSPSDYIDYGEGVYIERNVPTTFLGVYIVIRSGQTVSNLTFYPMLRDASIADDTYEPYHESVEEVVGDMRAEQTVLGAKNLLVPPDASKTQEGGIWTVNADGTISVSGTPTGFSGITFGLTRVCNKKYIVSGLSDVQNVKWGGATLKDISGNTLYNIADIPNDSYELDFSQYPNAYSLTIELKRISNNVEFSGIVYPMLRLASDPDNTYVPYAMTNREITDKLSVTKSEAVQVVEGVTVLNNHLKRQGNVVYLDLRVNGLTASQDSIIFKIPNGFIPSEILSIVAWMDGAKLLSIDTNGNLICASTVNNVSLRLTTSWII